LLVAVGLDAQRVHQDQTAAVVQEDIVLLFKVNHLGAV
jgi:hypothetical protein